MMYRLNGGVLEDTFRHFRACGCGRRECQVLWLSSWDSAENITRVVHPRHKAHLGGFVLDDQWLSDFWLELGVDLLFCTNNIACLRKASEDYLAQARRSMASVQSVSVASPRA